MNDIGDEWLGGNDADSSFLERVHTGCTATQASGTSPVEHMLKRCLPA